jgi:hypothetical protein
MQYITQDFAQVYGACSYGAARYEQNTCQVQASAGSSGSGSILTNTGFDILLIVTLACTIAFVAVIVRFWRRPAISQDEQSR